jgi:hypothetical protein
MKQNSLNPPFLPREASFAFVSYGPLFHYPNIPSGLSFFGPWPSGVILLKHLIATLKILTAIFDNPTQV